MSYIAPECVFWLRNHKTEMLILTWKHVCVFERRKTLTTISRGHLLLAQPLFNSLFIKSVGKFIVKTVSILMAWVSKYKC